MIRFLNIRHFSVRDCAEKTETFTNSHKTCSVLKINLFVGPTVDEYIDAIYRGGEGVGGVGGVGWGWSYL